MRPRPLLNTESSDVGHLVPQSQVAEIPLNGRNFWELTQLTPGFTFIPRSANLHVQWQRTQGEERERRGQRHELHLHGMGSRRRERD